MLTILIQDDRVEYSEGGDHNTVVKVGVVGAKPQPTFKESTNLSHGTLVANVACGTEFGSKSCLHAFLPVSPAALIYKSSSSCT